MDVLSFVEYIKVFYELILRIIFELVTGEWTVFGVGILIFCVLILLAPIYFIFMTFYSLYVLAKQAVCKTKPVSALCTLYYAFNSVISLVNLLVGHAFVYVLVGAFIGVDTSVFAENFIVFTPSPLLELIGKVFFAIAIVNSIYTVLFAKRVKAKFSGGNVGATLVRHRMAVLIPYVIAFVACILVDVGISL